MIWELGASAASLLAGLAFGRWWVGFQKERGITSRDIYKGIDGVPRAGGLVALFSASLGYLLLSPAEPQAAVVLFSALVIGVLGLLDDLRGVSEYVRVLLPVLVAFVVARALVDVRLTLPFVGLFYGATGWLSVLAIPVVTNAFNMLDPVNGFLPMANVAVGASLAAVAALRGQLDAVYLLLVHVAASLALYAFNKYPAKAFNGNVGSYYLGASISTIAVAYDLVAYLVLAALPFIINGALIIFSSGGIKGREKIQRPTKLVGGVVHQDCDSPILSLVRVVVSDKPLGEYQVFKALLALVAASAALTAALAAALRFASLPL
ncbi:MAG: UDP-N-acetylglucosamine--dolichyl-phosphate N-acetylglucosaminephosphotransferase [Pyrobaculum sp.]